MDENKIHPGDAWTRILSICHLDRGQSHPAVLWIITAREPLRRVRRGTVIPPQGGLFFDVVIRIDALVSSLKIGNVTLRYDAPPAFRDIECNYKV